MISTYASLSLSFSFSRFGVEQWWAHKLGLGGEKTLNVQNVFLTTAGI
jgi:hypothetical protein